MRTQWQRLEAKLKNSNPELLSDLNPPASDADITKLELQLGAKLPTDFVECLKIHDGQAGRGDGLFGGNEFLSSHRILDEWLIWKSLHDGGDFDANDASPDVEIKPVWWNPCWIPFTHNGMGDHLCLDLDPANDGQYGQVITLLHDDGTRKKISRSFSQWFFDFVEKNI